MKDGVLQLVMDTVSSIGPPLAWVVVGIVIDRAFTRIREWKDERARRERTVAALSRCLGENLRQIDELVEKDVSAVRLTAGTLTDLAPAAHDLLDQPTVAAVDEARKQIEYVSAALNTARNSYVIGAPTTRRVAAFETIRQQLRDVRGACATALGALGTEPPTISPAVKADKELE